ncbi:MAG TPA: cupin domain-containing protein, partial [Gaiella sp.]|nr:cupin domain-containing protein [Gaiella sp.]
MADLTRVNLHELVPEYDEDDPDGYRPGMARFGPAIGATQMGATLYELPPGQSICPYHYEYPEEEWLVVLSGRVVVRHPGGQQELGEGDVVCFPPGPDGAHKVTCLGDETARVLMTSTKRTPAIAVYP